MDCSRVRTEGIAERYLVGRLDKPDRDAFEDHLVACAACTEELAALCDLHGELERSREEILAKASIRRSPRGRHWMLAVAAAVVAVAAGLALWTRLQPVSAPEQVVTELSPLVNPEPTPASGPDLTTLSAFDPPPYAPVRLRGSEDDAVQRFADAMDYYAAGDWAGALPGLRAAAALDPEAPHMAFYHGACALLAGETGEAIRELKRTVALGDTPVLEEARFLMAKAYLREGDIDTAHEELVKVVALDGDRRQEAQDLLVRLDALGDPAR